MYSVVTPPFILIQLVSFAPQVQNEQVNTYEGAQVWRTDLRSSSDILLIKKLNDNQDISIWILTPKSAEFLVKSDSRLKVNRLLNSQSLNHTVLVMDVQRRVNSQRSESVLWDEKTLRAGHRLSWNQYPTLQIIEEYFNYLTENFPSICEVKTIGYTTENRTIKMVKISNGNPKNKAILITAGLHSREWITITSALYVLDYIVSKFDQLPQYMRNKEWIIIPLLNVDGYKFSYTHDRLWRKNRRQSGDCVGVDLNRNFGKDWFIHGITVTDKCSENYSGPQSFSEPESIALRDVILKSTKKPDVLIDLHSYGHMILYPWCARPELTNNNHVQQNTAEQMANAIYKFNGQWYISGAAYQTIYPATGAAIDWVYASGVPQSFAIEVGAVNIYGFLIPPQQIESNGKEILAAIRELAKVIDPGIFHRGIYYGPWF